MESPYIEPVGKQPGKNGGTLNVGGNKNGGRTPSEVRTLCRDSFEELIPKLKALANGAGSDSDQLRAIDLLGKYSGLTSVEVTSGDAPLKVYISVDPDKDL